MPLYRYPSLDNAGRQPDDSTTLLPNTSYTRVIVTYPFDMFTPLPAFELDLFDPLL